MGRDQKVQIDPFTVPKVYSKGLRNRNQSYAADHELRRAGTKNLLGTVAYSCADRTLSGSKLLLEMRKVDGAKI